MITHWTTKQIETPVLPAHAIEDSTEIFGISGVGGGALNPPNQPPRYATGANQTATVWFAQ